MKDNTAYISFGALWAEPITIQRLKISTLLFDKIHFEKGKIGSDFVESIIEVYGGGITRINSKALKGLSDAWISNDNIKEKYSIYGEKNRWPWEHAPQSLIEATKCTFFKEYKNNDCSNEELDYEDYKYAGYCMSDILYWQNHFRNSTFIGNTTTSKIVENLSIIDVNEARASKHITFECPDIIDIEWNDIVDLRYSPFLCDFRQKYFQLAEKNETDKLVDHYYNGLVKLAEIVKPKPTNEIVKAILVNLPIPPINPISIVSSVNDIYKSKTLKRDFGWLFFLNEITNKEENKNER